MLEHLQNPSRNVDSHAQIKTGLTLHPSDASLTEFVALPQPIEPMGWGLGAGGWGLTAEG